MTYSKANLKKALLTLSLTFLIACSADGNLDAKSQLAANPPVWVPVNSALMYGEDGSFWADCSWQRDLYVCAFYENERDAMVEQSYQLCSLTKPALIIDGFAKSFAKKYNTKGLFFLPVTPPIYYENGERQPSLKSDEEYKSLKLDACEQRFLPVLENR